MRFASVLGETPALVLGGRSPTGTYERRSPLWRVARPVVAGGYTSDGWRREVGFRSATERTMLLVTHAPRHSSYWPFRFEGAECNALRRSSKDETDDQRLRGCERDQAVSRGLRRGPAARAHPWRVDDDRRNAGMGAASRPDSTGHRRGDAGPRPHRGHGPADEFRDHGRRHRRASGVSQDPERRPGGAFVRRRQRDPHGAP